MGLIWGTIALLAAIVWAITIYDIIRRHLGAKHTTGWIVLVILLPFVGAVIYWALRKPTPDEVQRGVDAQQRAAGGRGDAEHRQHAQRPLACGHGEALDLAPRAGGGSPAPLARVPARP